MPRMPVDFQDENKLRTAFSWLTRFGMGHYFGNLPIGWYQEHQCHALDVIVEKLGGPGKVEVRDNIFLFGKRDDERTWRELGRTNDVYTEADRRARR